MTSNSTIIPNIDSSYKDWECPICLDAPKKVTLDCHSTHQLCLECAINIFGNIENNQVQRPKACPLCNTIVFMYVETSLIQKSTNKTNQISQNQFGQHKARRTCVIS